LQKNYNTILLIKEMIRIADVGIRKQGLTTLEISAK
jgi:hypothetical protein